MGRVFPRKTIRFAACAIAFASLSGCERFPNDIEGTTRNVHERGTLRAGIVSGPADIEQAERALARKIADAERVGVEFIENSSEILIRDLDEGRVDLVLGRFAKKSPWTSHAGLSGAAGGNSPPKKEPVLRAAVKLGENRWLMRVDRHIGGSD